MGTRPNFLTLFNNLNASTNHFSRPIPVTLVRLICSKIGDPYGVRALLIENDAVFKSHYSFLSNVKVPSSTYAAYNDE